MGTEIIRRRDPDGMEGMDPPPGGLTAKDMPAFMESSRKSIDQTQRNVNNLKEQLDAAISRVILLERPNVVIEKEEEPQRFEEGDNIVFTERGKVTVISSTSEEGEAGSEIPWQPSINGLYLTVSAGRAFVPETDTLLLADSSDYPDANFTCPVPGNGTYYLYLPITVTNTPTIAIGSIATIATTSYRPFDVAAANVGFKENVILGIVEVVAGVATVSRVRASDIEIRSWDHPLVAVYLGYAAAPLYTMTVYPKWPLSSQSFSVNAAIKGGATGSNLLLGITSPLHVRCEHNFNWYIEQLPLWLP